MSPFALQDEYNGQSFSAVELKGAILADKVFEDCTFTNCLFTESSLLRCKFIDCSFKKCDFSNLKVKDSDFSNLKGEESKLMGINWVDARELYRPCFSKCVLDFCNFSGVDLKKAKFLDCFAKEADFMEANLSESICRGTDFSGARFLRTNFSKADMRDAINYAIRPTDNLLKQAKFSLPEATLLLYGLDIILED